MKQRYENLTTKLRKTLSEKFNSEVPYISQTLSQLSTAFLGFSLFLAIKIRKKLFSFSFFQMAQKNKRKLS